MCIEFAKYSLCSFLIKYSAFIVSSWSQFLVVAKFAILRHVGHMKQ